MVVVFVVCLTGDDAVEALALSVLAAVVVVAVEAFGE